MGQQTYDVVVIGLGGMGSATAFHLARRGVRVLGVEQYDRNHEFGASHGDTRLIRKAYFEHPDYVPLLHRAYDLWDELEAESDLRLFHRTGLILAGHPARSQVIQGVRKAANEHDLRIDEYDPKAAKELFPQFHFDDDWTVLFEEDAGFLRVEECVAAHSRLAAENGATLLYNTKVSSWTTPDASGSITVKTSAGEFLTEKLVITAGPWASSLLAPLGLNIQLKRVVQHWFPAPASCDENHGMPCFGFDTDEGFFYGMPSRDGTGLKSASHSHGVPFDDPSFMDRSPDDPNIDHLKSFLARYIPEMPPANAIKSKPCIYTMSADEHFIIDRWPDHSDRVWFAAGFSGHGFKFASVIGELLADLATTSDARVPYDFLKLRPGLTR
jgi:sarcosine oxidase